MSDKVSPYREGMLAYAEGQVERSNPYRRGTPAWSRWLGGWRYANNLAVDAAQQERRELERAWAQ